MVANARFLFSWQKFYKIISTDFFCGQCHVDFINSILFLSSFFHLGIYLYLFWTQKKRQQSDKKNNKLVGETYSQKWIFMHNQHLSTLPGKVKIFWAMLVTQDNSLLLQQYKVLVKMVVKDNFANVPYFSYCQQIPRKDQSQQWFCSTNKSNKD